jgi:hypothetical protein
VVSYFILGLLAYWLFDYRSMFHSEALRDFMIPTDSPRVAAGPALQIMRGILFVLVLWPIRYCFLKREQGWFYLWALFIGLAILGTAGPSPGSLEGMIFTRLSIRYHLLGLPEVLLQILLFSLFVIQWYQRPGPWWKGDGRIAGADSVDESDGSSGGDGIKQYRLACRQ